MKTSLRLAAQVCALALICGACALPEPYRPPAPPPTPSPGATPNVPSAPQPTTTQPGTPTPPAVQTIPVPEPGAPVVREPVLNPASTSLVAQAQKQMSARNYPLASASIERALRIEPENPLLWIELAKVRQAEGNYPQAEALARRALSRSTQAPKTQAAAWGIIADSYRARGRNAEAKQAQAKSEMLRGG